MMKLFTYKKNYWILVGMIFCHAPLFLAKSKKKSHDTHHETHNTPQSITESLIIKESTLFKSPLVKEYTALAQTYYKEQNYGKALTFYNKALAMDEYNFDALKGLATIAFIQQEFNQATHYYETIIAHYPRCVNAHYNLGLCYLHNKLYEKASNALQKTVSLNTRHHKAWCALGSALEGENDSMQAIDAYKKAVALNPTFATAHFKLGLAYKTVHETQKSIEHLEDAYVLEPHNQHVIMELANLFNSIDETDKALTLYLSLLTIDRSNTAALYNCGFTLKKQGHLEKALAIYDKVLTCEPLYARAHFARAHILLALGNLEQGFQEYEWRFAACNETASSYSYPLWDGSDITNKTVLVRAEQSIDDTIQFSRYIPLLQQRGAKVIFQVQNNLKSLFQCSPHLATVIGYDESPAYCDLQTPLMSLPYLFKTTMNTIPPAFLSADKHLIAYWKSYLAHDNNVRIGVYWHDEHNQSIPQTLLESLAAIPHVTLYSLHRNDQQHNTQHSSAFMHHFDISFDTIHGPFMDSAAIIKNLDLVISIDSTIGHLAAALGAPTWILLPHAADWRWFMHRSDSPWYPTVRLFRQTAHDDWNSITSSLLHNVQLLAQERNHHRAVNAIDSISTQSLL